jgi:polysaccharide biosynthesis/export protein
MRIFFSSIWISMLLQATTSCVAYKQLLNYQENFPDKTQMDVSNKPDIRIQPNDVLGIKVFSTELELAAPFNLNDQLNSNLINIEAIQLNGYLVNQKGEIDFPVLGTLKWQGFSIAEAKESLLLKLEQHLKDPVVNLRLLNFRVTVSGEVRNPGAFTILNERVSLLDALALAGDLTDYADRGDVLLVRENNGVRSLNKINLHSADFFQSEHYYLKQNDLVYVKPIKAKAGAVQDQTSKAVPILTALATIAAVLIALFSVK